MFKTLKNKFPTAHIEVPQWGTNSENYAYIRKEGTKYHKDANGHYEYTDAQGKVHVGTNFSDTFEESGDLPPDAKQGDRNDLRMLYKLIASGKTMLKSLVSIQSICVISLILIGRDKPFWKKNIEMFSGE